MTFVFDCAGVEQLADRMSRASDDASASAASARNALDRAALDSTAPTQLDLLADRYLLAAALGPS